jgi:5'-deoxynucleotidase YfbR-like HD superfamily hydrolase
MNKLNSKIAWLLLRLSVKLCKVNHKAGIKTDGCFRTFTGRKFNILNPSFEMIDIRDIAKGLAYKPHFSGFSPKFFSIAEHSLAVEEMIALIDKDNYHARLEALLHDASEAYTGDMIKPIKNLLPNFVMIEKKIQSTIFSKYGIQPKSYDLDIKPTDNRIQDIEAMAFYRKDADLSPFERILVEKYIKYLTPDEALKEFTARFEWLIAKVKTYEKKKV